MGKDEALYRACNSDTEDLPTVVALLKDGADVNYNIDYGWTPLHWAARWGHIQTAQLLLEKGAKIETKTNIGRTPLHLAATKGHPKMVELLLERGAEIDAKDNDGWTPFFDAAHYKKGDVIKVLLANGVDKNIKATAGWYKDKSPVDVWPEFFRQLEENLKQELFSLMLCWEVKPSMVGELPKDVLLYLVKLTDFMYLLGLKRKRV
jgi:ankyrin repeat protein